MITPDQFTSSGTAWVDAFTVVATHFLSQAGFIVLAAFGLAKAVRTGEASMKARLDAIEKRQAEPGPEPEPPAEPLHA